MKKVADQKVYNYYIFSGVISCIDNIIRLHKYDLDEVDYETPIGPGICNFNFASKKGIYLEIHQIVNPQTVCVIN